MACVCVCAPIIAVNQERYRSMGGLTIGCCGDKNHTYGFHVPPCRLPNDDYSIRRSGGEGNQQWACAGDFSMNVDWSRKWLAWFLTRVRAGEYPQVLEIIGSLDGRTAMIWQRWNGWRAFLYTGGGHVGWCHISANRLRAAETPDFFAGWRADGSYTPAGVPIGKANNVLILAQLKTGAAVWKGNGLVRTGVRTEEAVRQLIAAGASKTHLSSFYGGTQPFATLQELEDVLGVDMTVALEVTA